MPIRRSLPHALAPMPAVALALSLAFSVASSLTSSDVAHASVVEALDLETLVREADSVLLARVIKQSSLYDASGRIVTDVQMQVEHAEKGDAAPGSAVVVRKLGGVVGDRGMRVAGEPSFTDGELVLVFAARGKKTYLRPIGMGQGTMRVYEQEGVRWARSDAQGMALTKRGNTTEKSRAAVPQPRKLDDLLSEVHALVAAQK